MKLVKEHINEKFSEESDPIKDLNIGVIHKIKKDYEKLREMPWNIMTEYMYPTGSHWSYHLSHSAVIYLFAQNVFKGDSPQRAFNRTLKSGKVGSIDTEFKKEIINKIKDMYGIQLEIPSRRKPQK